MRDPMPLAEAIAELHRRLKLRDSAWWPAPQDAAVRTLLAYAEAVTWCIEHKAAIGFMSRDVAITVAAPGQLDAWRFIDVDGPDLPAAVAAARAKLEVIRHA